MLLFETLLKFYGARWSMLASGDDSVPEKTIPVPAGSFVCRVAKTPHYDGVIRSVREPAVIASAASDRSIII